jgi:hypothetical protein
MFNKGGGAMARFEHPLNEYKGANVTRVMHDFYDSIPSAVLWRRRFRCAFGRAAHLGAKRAQGTAGWGQFKEYLDPIPIG